jgi:hypothetical protein
VAHSFSIRPGIPEVRDLWDHLSAGHESGPLDSHERELFEKLRKAFRHLSRDPYHPGLESHEITDLTRRYGQKVFQSYLENKTPSAGRIFWVYGPERRQITVIGIAPHPEDGKRGAYKRLNLSDLPPKRGT